MVSTSCSLLRAPCSLAAENPSEEDIEVLQWLASGDEKIAEVTLLARALDVKLNDHQLNAEDLEMLRESRAALASRAESNRIVKSEVRETLEATKENNCTRSPFTLRWVARAEAINLPPLPIATIGSFSQIKYIRRARAQLHAGELVPAGYDSVILAGIRCTIERQEKLGLGMLVHGEAEHNDMVQYLSEQLDGCLTATNGWIQGYDSRYVRLPILYDDITRPKSTTAQ